MTRSEKDRGTVAVLPLHEEAVERRLRVREEIRIRRTATTERHRGEVPLRGERAVNSRDGEPADGGGGRPVAGPVAGGEEEQA